MVTQLVNYNHENQSNNYVKIPGTETLNIELDRNDQSIIRYIYRNAILGSDSILSKMMTFVDNMLWFR